MQFFYEFFPILLFFVTFKYQDIYLATLVGIISTFVLSVLYRAIHKSWDKKQVFTLAVFLIFGGMTLYFHDPIFIKWKPTIIFWIFSLAILLSQFFTTKPIIQRLMENMLAEKAIVPASVWKRLNLVWSLFFLCLGAVNLFVAYQYTNDTWVNFKFYGITSALFMLSILQALYLAKFMKEPSK